MKSRRVLIQACLLVVLLLPAAVQAQFLFTTNNGTITITQYTGSGGAVTIPDATNGYPVTAIEGAFNQNLKVNSVIIGTNVTTIGGSAFYDCSYQRMSPSQTA
jgi:hypothetical protein